VYRAGSDTETPVIVHRKRGHFALRIFYGCNDGHCLLTYLSFCFAFLIAYKSKTIAAYLKEKQLCLGALA